MGKKIAFLILAHNDPDHLSKLVKALDYMSDIYIHIDKKSDINEFSSLFDKNNVYFLEDRVAVHWADISMIDAQMNLIGEVLKRSEEYSHAIFLSGSCFPKRNMKYIYEFFSSNPKEEFIKYIDMRESPEYYMKHIKFKWFKSPLFPSNNKLIKYCDKGIRFVLNNVRFKNDWDEKIVPYFGSQWIGLTLDCCKYVYDYHFSNNGFRKMNESTFSPDEHYIHTIVGNSFFAKNATGLQNFKGRGTWRLANFHIICPSLSKWYTLDDWDEISTNERLFVRKINSKSGSELVKKITDSFSL